MEMSKEQLARCAQNLSKTVGDHGLDSMEGLTAAAGEAFDPGADDDHHGEEFVAVDEHLGSIVVRYARRTGQLPIMLRVAPSSAKITLTCTEPLEGYQVFDEEPGLGKMQDRTFASFEALQEELGRLAALA